MAKSIKLNDDLYWDPTALYNTLGDRGTLTNPAFNSQITMGTFLVVSATTANNAPASGTLVLKVYEAGGRIVQEASADTGATYIRYYNGSSWTSWYTEGKILSGTAEPSSSLGNNGDIYIKY